jgi:hypothetical protein
MANSPSYIKAVLARFFFSLARIDRLHIIGCSRSGTTMLHAGMVCFENVFLSAAETPIHFPYLAKRIELALRIGSDPGRKHYITKRNRGWFKPPNRAELIAQTRFENIGLIHIVRDPRDVFLSMHSGDKQSEKPYVTREHWYDSILAADTVFEELRDYPRKLVIRYEDVVREPSLAEERIATTFELRRDARALPMNRVKDNFERLDVQISSSFIGALNGLRNMDEKSIGRWRGEEDSVKTETLPPEIRTRYLKFCEEHGYDSAYR